MTKSMAIAYIIILVVMAVVGETCQHWWHRGHCEATCWSEGFTYTAYTDRVCECADGDKPVALLVPMPPRP